MRHVTRLMFALLSSTLLFLVLIAGMAIEANGAEEPHLVASPQTTTTTPILYVAPDGKCGNAGTVILPCYCYADLQSAVDAAPPGAEIRVAVGTYTQTQRRAGLTQLLYLSKTLTLRGGYTTTHWQHAHPISFPTRLDAGGRGRVLYITGTISPTLTGFHITGGDAQGLGGDPDGTHAGGGVYIHQARVHLQQLRVYSNTAHVGGGLYLRESASTLSATVIAGNQAVEGGGGLYLHASDGANLRFNQITGNKILDGNGAGLALERSRARLDGNQITDNVAYQESGGGLSFYHHSDADLRNNVVANNRAGRAGSGIYIEGASPTLRHTTLVSNTGGEGSGIAVRAAIFWEDRVTSTVWLTNTIIGGQAVGMGDLVGGRAYRRFGGAAPPRSEGHPARAALHL